jgi:hypothetical protein
MADVTTTATTVTTLISEPLAQAGVVGAILIYCLYTDWRSRVDNRKMEIARIAREAEMQKDAQRREDQCNDRMREMQNRHNQQILGVIVRNNSLIECFLRKEGIAIPKTPTEGLDL